MYQKMWSKMSAHHDEVMTNSNAEGMDKVLAGHGRYAYIMETASMDYMTAR